MSSESRRSRVGPPSAKLGARKSALQTGTLIAGITLLAAGCTSVPPKGGFDRIQSTVAERTGERVAWRQGGSEDEAVEAAIDKLLQDELAADEAVQIALLNNWRLQATYEELGLAQANLVQAGLLSNPIFSSDIGFQVGSGSPDLLFGVTQSFLSILYRPLRKNIAQAQFEATQKQVAAAVIDLAADTRAAFYRVQADEQIGELLERVVAATGASFEAAQTLRAAGNITELRLHREQALHEESRLLLAEAQARLIADREQLTRLMGVWGQQASWRTARRLPEVPQKRLDLKDLERRAVARSLDLDAHRAQIVAAARRAGLTDLTALLPELNAGVEGEREDGEWDVGPTLALPLILFDQGQARKAAAASDLRRARARFRAQAIEVRSAARAAGRILANTRERALHAQNVVLPLRNRVVSDTQLQVNAMQIGVFDLLLAERQQINAALAFVNTRREYWLARTRLAQLLEGSAANIEAVGGLTDADAMGFATELETGGG